MESNYIDIDTLAQELTDKDYNIITYNIDGYNEPFFIQYHKKLLAQNIILERVNNAINSIDEFDLYDPDIIFEDDDCVIYLQYFKINSYFDKYCLNCNDHFDAISVFLDYADKNNRISGIDNLFTVFYPKRTLSLENEKYPDYSFIYLTAIDMLKKNKILL